MKMNKKKTIIDEIAFDSKLESQFYILLNEYNIPNYTLQPQFLLFEGFKYFDIDDKQHSYSKMVYTGDFQINSSKFNKPIVVEIKRICYTRIYDEKKTVYHEV